MKFLLVSSSSLHRSLCTAALPDSILTGYHSLVSSANLINKYSVTSSIMKMLNKIGPRRDPCVTSLAISLCKESSLTTYPLCPIIQTYGSGNPSSCPSIYTMDGSSQNGYKNIIGGSIESLKKLRQRTSLALPSITVPSQSVYLRTQPN